MEPTPLKIEDLLTDILQKKLIKVQQTPLTAPGENYGSLILAIKVTLLNEENEEETTDIVAKFLPLNEFMKYFMNASFTFRNELGFYHTILPTLRETTGKKLDFFPKFFGGRLEEPVILLENLKEEGYTLLDRFSGLDLQTSKIILEKMAEFHASVIALKETKPRVFETKLAPFFEEFQIFQMGEGEHFMASEVIVKSVMEIVRGDKFCASHLKKIEETIETCIGNLKLRKNSPKFRDDVFATLIHDDLWVNNIMVKTCEDVKLIDWQLYHYASATKDILFFIYTSIAEEVLEESSDDLVLFYYDNLVTNLKELGCDMAKFSFDVFQNEMKKSASQVTYFYIMIALPSMLASGDKVWEVSELSKERMLAQFEVSDISRRRIALITRHFIQKGWL